MSILHVVMLSHQRGWQLKQEGQVAGLLNKHGC